MMFRITGTISGGSLTIMENGDDKDGFLVFGGPGGWNDPDMLVIGNFGLSLSAPAQELALEGLRSPWGSTRSTSRLLLSPRTSLLPRSSLILLRAQTLMFIITLLYF